MFKDDVRKYFKVTLAPELKQTNKEKNGVKASPSVYFTEESRGGVGVGWVLKPDHGFKVFVGSVILG